MGTIILKCVKFGDNPISSLDFSFIGGVPLNEIDGQQTKTNDLVSIFEEISYYFATPNCAFPKVFTKLPCFNSFWKNEVKKKTTLFWLILKDKGKKKENTVHFKINYLMSVIFVPTRILFPFHEKPLIFILKHYKSF